MTQPDRITQPLAPTTVEMDTVRRISDAVSAAHLFVYLVPELAEEAERLGVTERQPRYFAYRAAALGAVPWQVVMATFYNFSPRVVRTIEPMWAVASPDRWQAARFTGVERAMHRVGVTMSSSAIVEARELLGAVVAEADFAARPLAAANAAVDLPIDPLVALWQQITVVREWRGDAHVQVLASRDLGPCECNVIHTATGRLSTAVIRATRGWNDDEWAAATERLVTRGWLHDDGTPTAEGLAGREEVELATDAACRPLWSPIGDAGARRLAGLIAPIHRAFDAAGTFQALRP
jgi:hypothetical protein